MSYTLIPLPCRSDNYIWLLHNTHHAWVIDPSMAAPVQNYIAQHGLILADLLITHHHHDHVEGIAGLMPLLQGHVIGASSRIHALTKRLNAPCSLQLSFSDIRIDMLPSAGHTHDHVSYFMPDAQTSPVLFCGDSLFSAGCGRIFDGTVAQYVDTFIHLMQLPDNTRIAAAHEYTLSNLAFALAIDSGHVATQQYNNQVKYARARGEPSLPSTLALEKQINPFIRSMAFENDWVAALTKFAMHRGIQEPTLNTPLDAFTLCRALKDAF